MTKKEILKLIEKNTSRAYLNDVNIEFEGTDILIKSKRVFHGIELFTKTLSVLYKYMYIEVYEDYTICLRCYNL